MTGDNLYITTFPVIASPDEIVDEAISYFLIQIQPFSIKTVNQINLPLSWTGLYLFLPHNSIFWIFKDLIVNYFEVLYFFVNPSFSFSLCS